MRFLFICLVIFAAGYPVLAQEDTSTFNIRVFGGTDNTPPTTPTLLSATPITTNQIDLLWSTSTDNFAVGGYVVLRGSSTIATTTQLTYSDTGLLASTTYTYAVRAFDTFYNYSTTSNIISTTTLDIPPVVIDPVASGTGSTAEGTVARMALRALLIDTGISTTSFELTTGFPGRLEMRWGRTASYELGYIVRDTFARTHLIYLTDLEPDTKYEYEIIAYTPRGEPTVLTRGQFTTEGIEQSVLVPNVRRFEAAASTNDVALSWELPALTAGSYVRVLRSHLGFPQHLQDGAIVYQGLGESYVDEAILAEYSPVYYTAFVVDAHGNVSSGAVAMVFAIGDGDTSDMSALPPGTSLVSSDQPTSTIRTDRVTVDMKMPDLNDIQIIQNDRFFTMLDIDATLDSRETFTVSIPKIAIAGNLKSIIATVIDPTDNRKTYSFLLRINKDQTSYLATIAPLFVFGRSQLVVEIYDYEALVVATYQTPLTFSALPDSGIPKTLFPDVLFDNLQIILLLATIPFIILLVWLLITRAKGDEDNQ